MMENDKKIIQGLTKNQAKKWSDTIEKLHRIDGVSFEEIKETIIFGRTDSFWKGNFHSVAPLRDKKNDTTKFYKINQSMKHGKENRSVDTDNLQRIAEITAESCRNLP